MSSWPPRPSLSASFYKAHGLGNDYLVFREGDDWLATVENVRTVCHPHRGVGSDGIVVLLDGPGYAAAHAGPDDAAAHGAPDDAAAHGAPVLPEFLEAAVQVRLRMFNPDGGEFERSGNGLRVLASYLLRRNPSLREMDVEVGGGRVRMVGHGQDNGVYDISVDMGRAVTGPSAVGLDPDAMDVRGRLDGPDGDPLDLVAVSVGNPHAVVICADEGELTEERLATVGPHLASHSAFRQGTNVQLALADGEGRCRALIWERGVGRTSASGTSACAVAVALVSRGLLRPGEVEVEMPGGRLRVAVTPELDVVLRGPVEEVMEGRLTQGLLGHLG